MKQKKSEETEEDLLEETPEEEQEEQEEDEAADKPKAKQVAANKKWGVSLVVIDEKSLPQKVVVNTKTGESLDIYLALAEILNNQEKLKKLLD